MKQILLWLQIILVCVMVYIHKKQSKVIEFQKLYISELQSVSGISLDMIYINKDTKDEMVWVKENVNPKPFGTWVLRKHWWKWSIDSNGMCRDTNGKIIPSPYNEPSNNEYHYSD